MMHEAGRCARRTLLLLAIAVLMAAGAEGSVKPRAILVVPFDVTGLGREEQWMGQGVAEVIGLGLDQHPGFVQIEDARLRAVGRPEAWGEPVVIQAARTLRADAALFGAIRQGLREGKITVNRSTALIHIVKEGVLVVTPLAFRQFARRYQFLMDVKNNEDDVVKRVQSRLQKVMSMAKLHFKTQKGLNIHTYKITGPNRETMIRGWLLPTSAIYGDNKPPNINSALENISGFADQSTPAKTG